MLPYLVEDDRRSGGLAVISLLLKLLKVGCGEANPVLVEAILANIKGFQVTSINMWNPDPDQQAHGLW